MGSLNNLNTNLYLFTKTIGFISYTAIVTMINKLFNN